MATPARNYGNSNDLNNVMDAEGRTAKVARLDQLTNSIERKEDSAAPSQDYASSQVSHSKMTGYNDVSFTDLQSIRYNYLFLNRQILIHRRRNHLRTMKYQISHQVSITLPVI